MEFQSQLACMVEMYGNVSHYLSRTLPSASYQMLVGFLLFKFYLFVSWHTLSSPSVYRASKLTECVRQAFGHMLKVTGRRFSRSHWPVRRPGSGNTSLSSEETFLGAGKQTGLLV